MNIDLIILLLLASLIARRIVMLWSGRKRGLAGSHLHVRLVYVFSILAAAPVIIMTVFSAFFFHFGVQAWFSQRVQTAINESQAVAQSYLEEHKQVIRADTLAMADDLNRQADILLLNPRAFDTIMDTQSSLRNLSEALVFDEKGKIIARAGLTFALELEKVPPYALHQADESGDVVLMTTQSKDRVRALVKLHNFENTYLFVGRMVDPQVLKHLRSTEEATQDYNDLQSKYGDLQVTVTLLFVVVGLLLAMLVGGVFGDRALAWSALYGAAVVVLPGALMARGMTSPLGRASPGAGAVSFVLWELVKIAVAVGMLMLAPRLVQPLSWPALLAGLVVCMKVYWIALLWRGR